MTLDDAIKHISEMINRLADYCGDSFCDGMRAFVKELEKLKSNGGALADEEALE